MHKKLCLLPALALALLCACSSGEKKTPPTRPTDFVSSERQFTTPTSGDIIAIFDTSLGEVRAVLYPDAAPMAVYNFVGLARSGYYDNTTIWRSEYGFAVQGGDATGTGTGGSTIWSITPTRWRLTRASSTTPGRSALRLRRAAMRPAATVSFIS